METVCNVASSVAARATPQGGKQRLGPLFYTGTSPSHKETVPGAREKRLEALCGATQNQLTHGVVLAN